MKINCDLAEDWGIHDAFMKNNIFSKIDIANVSTGTHAGDEGLIEATLDACIKNKTEISAHPSYPDRTNFGRKSINLPLDDLIEEIKEQYTYLESVTNRKGVKIKYVKFHGALYNDLALDHYKCIDLLQGLYRYISDKAIIGLPNSGHEIACHDLNIKFLKEGFADRRYTEMGFLLPRENKGSVLVKSEVIDQYNRLINMAPIASFHRDIQLYVDTICFHSDHPEIIEIMNAI